jgi:hypothetical protein
MLHAFETDHHDHQIMHEDYGASCEQKEELADFARATMQDGLPQEGKVW